LSVSIYQKYLNTGVLENRAAALMRRLSRCDICPRNCGVDRMAGEIGFCGVGERVWVSWFGPHHGEEDPLRGTKGSGTIFFSGCNLNCLYCQNAEISQEITGEELTNMDLAQLMLDIQGMGCHNINLVSPSHVVPQIAEAIYLAAGQGLDLPVVYNSGGYDAVDTLQKLDGFVDIYMPDMKYSDAGTGQEFSGIPLYPEVNQAAVLEMHHQVGDLRISGTGIGKRGLLIRHLVLPNDIAGSKEILEFVAIKISRNTYLNIMDQYNPAHLAYLKTEINRRITSSEYQEIVEYARSLGLVRLDQRS